MTIYNREDYKTVLPQLEKQSKQINEHIDDLGEKLKTARAGIDELSSRDVYRTEEQKIGTWVDGKPLYRKVYVYDGNWSANTTGNFSVADLNIDTCVSLRGYLASASYKHIGLDFYNSSFNYVYMNASSVVYWKVAWASTRNTFVIEYTKTTD